MLTSPSAMRVYMALVVTLIFAPPPAVAVRLPDTAASGVWRRLGSSGGGAQESVALAQSRSGEIAVADDAGVTWWQGDERHRVVLPLIRDLAFDSENLLWIATDHGLFSWSRMGRPLRKRLPGGEAGNRIARIAVSDSSLLVATGGGALWSADGKIFQPLQTSAATSAIFHVAIRSASFDQRRKDSTAARGGIAQAWIYGVRGLSVVRGLESASGLRITGTDVLPTPLSRTGPSDGGIETGVVDLVIDPEGRRVFLVLEDSVVWRWIEEADAFLSARSNWHHERPNLPPGTSIRGLGWAAGRVWIATDHGLLSADTLAGPFRRAASPVGTNSCVDIQARTHARALVLCRTGIFELGRASFEGGLTVLEERTSGLATRPFELLPDPPLAEIRRRALGRSGLTVGRADSMWKRLRRRAYWPEVELSFDVEFDSDREWDFDQAYISGDTRSLVDRTRDRGRRYRATLELDWDLGNVIYPDDTVDLSREFRQIITLRDDVVDEINQLYFERQAIRESLSHGSFRNLDSASPFSPSDSLASSTHPGQKSEAIRLWWRARELDAGLDAWTGGWISRWRSQPLLRLDPENHHPNDEE